MDRAKRTKKPLSKAEQVAIFQRDGWLCAWCKRPVIFGPVMKFLEAETRNAGQLAKLTYYHAHWTRHGAPLLDELGAVLDHAEPFSTGGPDSKGNLVTACNKCNGRKSSASLDKWDKRFKRKPIKGKYGEPQNWDGLSSVFVMLAERSPTPLSFTEKSWLKALKSDDSVNRV